MNFHIPLFLAALILHAGHTSQANTTLPSPIGCWDGVTGDSEVPKVQQIWIFKEAGTCERHGYDYAVSEYTWLLRGQEIVLRAKYVDKDIAYGRFEGEELRLRWNPDLGSGVWEARLQRRTKPVILPIETPREHYLRFLEHSLRLPEATSPAAVTRLTATMRGEAYGDPHVAAQALFALGSEEAHTVLRRELRSPSYDFEQGIRHAFGVPISMRNEFIGRYHLTGRSKDVAITLSAEKHWDSLTHMVFVIRVENRSGHNLRLYDPHWYYGLQLILVLQDGTVMKSERSSIIDPDLPLPDDTQYPQFASGEALQMRIPARIRRFPDASDIMVRKWPWLDCEDCRHRLTDQGLFHVYAAYEWRGRLRAPFDNVWIGRVVSDPIDIELKERQ